MGSYVYKLYIGKNDYFANFADAIPRAGEGLDGGMFTGMENMCLILLS